MSLDLVLVTYNPDYALLQSVIQSISSQVRFVFIVDNGSVAIDDMPKFNDSNVVLIKLNVNMGIAYAQNVGIKESMQNGSDYILLSDQDTIYPACFVETMFKGLNEDVAAISPLFNDAHQKGSNQGFVKKGLFGFTKFYPTSGLHTVFQTIASGCILNTKHLESIGLMNEELFIDWVDIEWCWRATKKGFKLLGNANVVISHRLGDNSINFGFREINVRSPFRHYFITRNAFYLALNCTSLDPMHRLVLLIKSFRYLFAFPIISKPHFEHFKYTFRGFYHGVIGKLGKYE